MDYQWYQTATLTNEDHVNALSWNLEGTRLLVGGSSIQLWQCPEENDISCQPEQFKREVGFTLGNSCVDEPDWGCIWSCRTSAPVHHLHFSPDGLLFASASKVIILLIQFCNARHLGRVTCCTPIMRLCCSNNVKFNSIFKM